jgi:uncharacterized membrane protein
MHALWNSIGKHSATSAGFYVWANVAGIILYSPLVIPQWQEIIQLSSNFWLLLLISGGFQTVYLMGLSKAYKSADLTLVYPLARALPVLIVPIIVLVVNGQSLLSVVDMLALGMITIGAVVMPITRWRTWHMDMYLNAGVGWVFLAAIGTAGY